MFKMAGSLAKAQCEAAFEAFNAEFVRNGFGKAPEGLMKLLRDFALKEGESPKDGRARLYKRLWCLLLYGSGRTLGMGLASWPTYVYPATLKEIVRCIIPGNVMDHDDPSHVSVYKVNIGELAAAKWPTTKKATGKRPTKK